MDQKNTIVKCKAHPNCLFNYNGVCDNYVINIDADGKCEGYIETASKEQIQHENYEFKGYSITKPNKPIQLKMTIAEFDKITKNKSTIKEMVPECDLAFCKPNCVFCTLKNDLYYCMLKKSRIDAFGFICSKYREEKNEV